LKSFYSGRIAPKLMAKIQVYSPKTPLLSINSKLTQENGKSYKMAAKYHSHSKTKGIMCHPLSIFLIFGVYAAQAKAQITFRAEMRKSCESVLAESQIYSLSLDS
jgi:hypothetical protein